MTGRAGEDGRPALSLILCSRNDAYMGNSRWRLATALEYLGRRVREGGWHDRVEVVVADWGSDAPLREAVALSPDTAGLVSFVEVPPALARARQHDSPFAEVVALNAAARRARGDFIGRIDQDTLVGARFLRVFFDVIDGRLALGTAPAGTLFFSNLRMAPYRLAARCPPLADVERFVARFGDRVRPEHHGSREPFYVAGVGIWLAHRDRWHEAGGYDERMIYMNAMETNMIRRLLRRYPIVDLGRLAGHPFYHLEHYHPWRVRRTSAHRKVNPHEPFADPDALRANGDDWGLAAEGLAVKPARVATGGPAGGGGQAGGWRFARTLVIVRAQMAGDAALVGALSMWRRWRRRAAIAGRAMRVAPVLAWPRVLRALWRQRAAGRS